MHTQHGESADKQPNRERDYHLKRNATITSEVDSCCFVELRDRPTTQYHTIPYIARQRKTGTRHDKLTGVKDAVHILLTSDTSLTSPTRPNLSISIASSPSFNLKKNKATKQNPRSKQNTECHTVQGQLRSLAVSVKTARWKPLVLSNQGEERRREQQSVGQ